MFGRDKATKIYFNSDARSKLMQGIETIAKAVGSTLGPMGQCVIIEREGMTPHVTKDGVTVSKSLRLQDPCQALGAELVKEAASRTNDFAGDGTTTATVLAHAMCKLSTPYLMSSDISNTQLVAEFDAAVKVIAANLSDYSREVSDDELESVATISANGEASIGRLIADAVLASGRDGIVTVEESKSSTTSLEVVNGMMFDHGYISPFFATDGDKMRCTMNDAYVLVYDGTISSLQEFVPVLEGIHRQGRPLLIIANEIDGEALKLLVLNKTQNSLQTCAVIAPQYDFGAQRIEGMLDIAEFVSGGFCSPATGGLSAIKIGDLGVCKRVVVDRNSTRLIMDKKKTKNLQARVDSIREQLDEASSDSDVRHMTERLARISGAAAVIRVGGSSEFEMKERRDRVDDALNATKAAIAEGILAGGGTALALAAYRVAQKLPKTPGLEVATTACYAPLLKIAENAGRDPAKCLAGVIEMNARTKVALETTTLITSVDCYGYDARADDYKQMVLSGIIDPARVTRFAFEYASSVARSFMTLSAAVVDVDEHVAHSPE